MIDPNWIQYAAIVQAFAAIMQGIIAFLLWNLARRQTQAQNISALRDIFSIHHSKEMREAREFVRKNMKDWLRGRPENELKQDSDFQKYKHAFEDMANYYENLGMIMKLNPHTRDIILEMTHNSAVSIWDEVIEPNKDLFRSNISTAKDYAGNFKELVDAARKYRWKHRLS